MAVILTTQSPGTIYYASSVLNDSTVSGATVQDALNNLYSIIGLNADNFVFNQPLTTVSGLVIFSIPDTPRPGTVQVFVNGQLQEPGVTKDYTISGSIITFNRVITGIDILLASYIKYV